uniref:Putative secreted protein n=1 Tax=Anopheles darlingi TaxID=43151 RepID=A0A2M4D841_ANODA
MVYTVLRSVRLVAKMASALSPIPAAAIKVTPAKLVIFNVHRICGVRIVPSVAAAGTTRRATRRTVAAHASVVLRAVTARRRAVAIGSARTVPSYASVATVASVITFRVNVIVLPASRDHFARKAAHLERMEPSVSPSVVARTVANVIL